MGEVAGVIAGCLGILTPTFSRPPPSPSGRGSEGFTIAGRRLRRGRYHLRRKRPEHTNLTRGCTKCSGSFGLLADERQRAGSFRVKCAASGGSPGRPLPNPLPEGEGTEGSRLRPARGMNGWALALVRGRGRHRISGSSLIPSYPHSNGGEASPLNPLSLRKRARACPGRDPGERVGARGTAAPVPPRGPATPRDSRSGRW